MGKSIQEWNRNLQHDATMSSATKIKLTLDSGEEAYIEKGEIAKVLSELIKNDSNSQANVTFGAKTSAELASVVAGQEPLASSIRRARIQFTDLGKLKSAVADQNLAKYGLQVGDWYRANGRDYVIAGLNVMKGTSTPYRVTANHVGLIVIPHTTHAWNVSGKTNQGANGRGEGYANCDLHAYLKDTVLPWCQTDLGSGNLIAHSKLLSTAVNTAGYNRRGEASGCSSSWAWQSNQYICALSEVQVYGATVWSSSGFDTGEACRQLDVFRVYNHTEIFGGEYPWLRDVVSASLAAFARDYGNAGHDAASGAIYVAALILFH